MDFSAGSLFVSFLVGGVGFVALTYGKRQRRLPQMVVGAALMVFPYFVSSTPLTLLIATVLLALMWGAIRAGF